MGLHPMLTAVALPGYAIYVQQANRGHAKAALRKAAVSFILLMVGWLMGLEPTTTRITIWDSTN